MEQPFRNRERHVMTTKIALVSCVKMKRTAAVAARDLYISPLFVAMRRYAEDNADGWYVLSAEHGLLRPNEVISPYNRTLKTMVKAERDGWASRVQRQLLEVLPPNAVVIMLAGVRYREGLIPFLATRGFSIEVPMLGLKLGPQLRWLKAHTR
jgi:hypothetical protein